MLMKFNRFKSRLLENSRLIIVLGRTTPYEITAVENVEPTGPKAPCSFKNGELRTPTNLRFTKPHSLPYLVPLPLNS